MIHLSAPHAIGEHVYFLLGNTITEGITTACTLKFDGTQVNTIYVVAFIDADGPTTATMHKDNLFATRTDLVNNLMHNADQLTPDETAEIVKHYDITAPSDLWDYAAAEPKTEPEATLGSVMAEVAQQWRKQLDEQPEPVER